MATFGRTIRRGLPRRPGADPWPPAGEASIEVAGAVAGDGADSLSGRLENTAPQQESAAVVEAPAVPVEVAPSAPVAAPVVTAGVALRRGLPRTPGGEAWPPASAVAASATPAVPAAAAAGPAVEQVAPAPVAAPAAASTTVSAAASVVSTTQLAAAGSSLRRGLPRTAGGDPWPPAGTVVASVATPVAAATVVETPAAPAPVAAAVAPVAVAPVAVAAGPRAPLTVPRTVWPGETAFRRPAATAEPTRVGPFTKGQWAGIVLVGGAVLLLLAGMAVAFVRFFLGLSFMQDFLAAFPGEYHLPEGAPVGFPAWLGWQHFFNVFLMVLIIRSGLQIRHDKRPSAFWASKRDPKRKISLSQWFHQSLDILWVVNGAIFVVLLFVTGQWMRIVPTSWEVFPNALSSALQYVSLDWPTENGWVNYNSLQQLAYFTTVFIAAPLSAITGWRMSDMWPKNNETLSRLIPLEAVRKVHYPVMLYFVAFIFVHVTLVFATGALRNLNHMYAAQGSVDGVQYADNWTGFWLFFVSIVVIAGAFAAARPLVLAPIARLFGTVSSR